MKPHIETRFSEIARTFTISLSMRKQDLEQRLITFSVRVLEIVKIMPRMVPEESLAKQLGRSSTSVSLNYGEAQSAESRKDFVHKIKIVL